MYGFYDAARARQIAMGLASGSNLLLAEINTLQTQVDAAASSGSLEVTVGTSSSATVSTAMTVSADYFNAWNNPYVYDTATHKLARETMNFVVNYFSRLGYAIKRSREGVTNNFNWKITW